MAVRSIRASRAPELDSRVTLAWAAALVESNVASRIDRSPVSGSSCTNAVDSRPPPSGATINISAPAGDAPGSTLRVAEEQMRSAHSQMDMRWAPTSCMTTTGSPVAPAVMMAAGRDPSSGAWPRTSVISTITGPPGRSRPAAGSGLLGASQKVCRSYMTQPPTG